MQKNYPAYTEALNEANKLLSELNTIADSLPYNMVYDLSNDIRFFTEVIISNIDVAYLGANPKARFFCKLRVIEAMNECKECLELIKRLKYYDTGSAINKIDEFEATLKAA